MAVKYTSAAYVRAFIGEKFLIATSDTDIGVWIEEAEGIIDTWLKIGSGTGANSLTFSAAKKPHLVLELAATALAASIVISHSVESTSTMEQSVFVMQNAIYWWEEAKKILTEQEYADFILEQ